MSWHFLQEQEAASWEGTCLDGAPSALLSLMPTPEACCLPASVTDCCRGSRFGMTCEPLTASHGQEACGLLVEDSPARTSAQPEKAQDSTANALDFGEKWPASLARYDQSSRSWKTAQFSLLGGLESFSGTWPKWGLMQGGESWALDTLAHATDATESGFVPTVLTSEATGPGLHGNGSHNFRTWFRENSTERRLPLHGELMMLWPEGWASAGEPLETDKFRQWLRKHGGC